MNKVLENPPNGAQSKNVCRYGVDARPISLHQHREK